MVFIDGVTLLEALNILTLKGSVVQAAIEIGIMVLVFFVIGLVYKLFYNEFITGLLLVGYMIFLFFDNKTAVIENWVITMDGCKIDTGEYRVTVTEDTDMREFFEEYELVDYTNGVYTIKIKDKQTIILLKDALAV